MNPDFKMYFLLKMVNNPARYVSLPQGISTPILEFCIKFPFFARRWTKTATITRLTPGRDYRAFVRAVSVVGNGTLEIPVMKFFSVGIPEIQR